MPTQLSERAASDLRYIRETMTQAASFTAVSGVGYLVIGTGALFAGLYAATVASPSDRVGIWMADAVFSAIVGLYTTLRKARAAGQPLVTSAFRKFSLGFAPAIVVGAVMTVVLSSLGAYAAMPGLWLLCYGAGLVAGGAFSVRLVPVMGACFMTLGIVAAVCAPRYGSQLMILGFAALHLLFGLVVLRRYGG